MGPSRVELGNKYFGPGLYMPWRGTSGVSGNDFWTFGNGNGNDKLHSQLLGTGTGMKISFPIFGNGNGNGNSIPEFWEREREKKFNSHILGTGMSRCYSRE